MLLDANQPTDPLSLRARLESLLCQRAIGCVFQPIACIPSGRLIGAESFVRPRADTGFTCPVGLLTAARRTNLLWEVEMLALETSIHQAGTLPVGALLFLNASPTVFADRRFAGGLSAFVASQPSMRPARVVVEITDWTGDHEVDLSESARALRQAGFQLALDDLGTGANGMARLKALAPRWLKLDRGLVRGIHTDRSQRELVRFLVQTARLSGTIVVGEGVERFEELDALIDLGVRFVQGRLTGQPAPIAQPIDGQVARELTSRWAKARDQGQGGDLTLGSLAHACGEVQANERTSEVRRVLSERPDDPGVVVLDGRRFVGWCSRAAIESASAGVPVSECITSIGLTVRADAPVSEGLEAASTRDDSELAVPLVVMRDDRVVGVLPMRTLLSAGANGAQTRVRLDPLTRLPGAVAVEEHLRARILASRGPGLGPQDHTALIIDFADFHRFNEAYGYDAGDRRVRSLSTLVAEVLIAGQDSTFFGALGADRFLVTTPAHDLDMRLNTLIERFARRDAGESNQDEFVPPSLAVMEGSQPRTPTSPLRVLVIPRIFARIAQPRDLLALEQQMRQRAAARPDRAGPGWSVTWDDRQGMRAARAA